MCIAVAVFVVPSIGAAQTIPVNAGVEAAVREAFADAPIMIDVARCESRFRQFAEDGSALRGGSGKAYIGTFQIGERLHKAPAAAMGYDIETLEGNIAYARYLYGQSGAVPWRECIPAGAVTTAPAAAQALSANLVLGARGVQVLALQRMLNARGFAIAASGPGSQGNETTFFGALTREALRRFQCAKGIVCNGAEATTGYGRLGPRTRAALNAVSGAE